MNNINKHAAIVKFIMVINNNAEFVKDWSASHE